MPTGSAEPNLTRIASVYLPEASCDESISEPNAGDIGRSNLGDNIPPDAPGENLRAEPIWFTFSTVSPVELVPSEAAITRRGELELFLVVYHP